MKQPETQNLPLTGHQLALYEALKGKKTLLADMYLSSIQVYNQKGVPNRIALTAHGIREMMDQLPRFINVPIENNTRKKLGDLMDQFKDAWDRFEETGKWPIDNRWNGKIDLELEILLKNLEDFILSASSIKKNRKLLALSLLEGQKFDSHVIPESFGEMKSTEWLRLLDYFVKIAHFNPYNEDEFESQIVHLERFLLNYFEPSPYETQEALLNLIKLGEPE